MVNLDIGDGPVVLKSGSHFPTQYFSVRWTGFILPSYSETYRIYLHSQRSAAFTVRLNGQLIISNTFDLADNSLPKSAYFASADIELVADKLLSLEVTYAERLGSTYIKLFWESDT